MSDSLRPYGLQHSRLPCPSPTPKACSNSCPLSWWCCPTISSSVIPFSSCPQSLPASESFPMSQLFAWGGQSTGVSALASFLPKKSQGWSPLELYTFLFAKEWWRVGSRTPFTPGLGYRESGELLTPDHLDNSHSLPVCVETDMEPRWTSPKSLEPHSLIYSFNKYLSNILFYTSMPCTVVGTGDWASSQTKSPIQWEEKDNKQTNEYMEWEGDRCYWHNYIQEGSGDDQGKRILSQIGCSGKLSF